MEFGLIFGLDIISWLNPCAWSYEAIMNTLFIKLFIFNEGLV